MNMYASSTLSVNWRRDFTAVMFYAVIAPSPVGSGTNYSRLFRQHGDWQDRLR